MKDQFYFCATDSQTHQNRNYAARLPSLCGGDTLFGLIMLDLEKDYCIYEQWLWNGVCIEGKQNQPSLGEKTSCVNSDTPSAKHFESAHTVFVT